MQDSFLNQLMGPQKQADPLAEQLREEARRDAIAALSRAQNPDQAAKAARIARQNGLPADLVERNLPKFEAREQTDHWANIMAAYPAAVPWMVNPGNAAVASDDHKSIGLLGQVYQGVANIGSSLKAGVLSASAGMYGLARMVAEAGETISPVDWAQKSLFGTSLYEQIAKFSATSQKAVAADAATARPKIDDFYARNLLSGVESVPTTAASILLGTMGSPAAGAAFMGGTTTGNAYDQARNAGLPVDRAVVFATSQGAVEYATEKIPLGRLIGDIAAKTAFAKVFVRQLVTELPQEQVATVLQDLNEWAALNPEKPFSEYLAARPQAAVETALATIGGIAGNASVARAFTAAASGIEKLGGKRFQADQAVIAADALDRIASAAADSRTRARDPDAFAGLLRALGGNAVENVHIPGEAVRAYLQSDDQHDQEFWSPLSSQIEEAVALGGDVVIPAEQALAHLSGTKAWESLREDMRLTPGGMSLREAQQFESEFEDTADSVATEAAAGVEADRVAAEPRQKLHDSIYSKLVDAGYTPETARVQAELVSARISTRAERMGQELTGNEFDQTEVNQVLPSRLARALSEDRIDSIADMAKGIFAETFKPGDDDQDAPTVAAARELLTLLDENGIDPAKASVAQISSFVQQYRAAAEGGRGLEQGLRKTVMEGFLAAAALTATPAPVRTEIHAPVTEVVGQVAAGNIDVHARPIVRNEDGTISTVRSISIGTDAGEVLIPTVSDDGKLLTDDEAVALYEKTGRHLGIFDSPDHATAFAKSLHDEQAREYGRQLFQSYMDGPRGRVTFIEGRNVIDLFEKRDLSTFIHESGHIWLEELKADAESPDAPVQVRADWKAVKAWFSTNGHKIGKDGVIPTDAHELWARGIERFAMEGKAPSSALRRAFDAFRSWLLTIYQVVDNLRSPISPEVRDVMRRLLATDEEISDAQAEQEVRALFTDAAQAGMTEAEFAAYETATNDARDAAHDALLYRTMHAVRAQRTKEYKDQRATVRADVAEKISSRREFRALAILRDKSNGLRLDRQFLLDTYGPAALDSIPKNVPPLHAENGSSADAIAEMAGFETGDEMVRMLMGIEARRKELRAAGDKRSVRDSVIDEETDAIMTDRYGDPLADGSIEREARELVHNDKQGEVIASELRALSRKRPNLQPTPYQLAKRWAARKVSEGTVAEYTSRSAIQRYQRSSRKAGQAAEAAMLAGDIDETFRQKQAQMLNSALVSEATRAADAVEAAVSRLSKVAKRRTMKSVDQDYLEQAQSLLEQVELRTRSQVSIDRQGRFEAWAREREAEGHDVIVPASFEASLGTAHYSRLSVERLLGLDDAVKQILHLGRLKQTLLDGAERREFVVVVQEAVDAAGKLPPKAPSDLMEPGFPDRLKAGIASMDAALLKLETIFDWLDGGKADGVFNRIAFRPVAEAQDRENAMLADYYARIRETMKAVPRENVRRWGEKVSIPGLINRETGNPFVMTRQSLVSMALNMGNEGNIQRLTDGYGWSEQTVRDVLNRELTAQEWQFVQQIWDIFETLWPEISGMERRINGVEPDKVEARPVETPHGTFRGGYFPAVYDTARDLTAEKQAALSGDKFGALYTRATTRSSSTKERTEKVSRPILLQLGVINRHLGEVIHDITHREAVMQADKFLSSERVMRAVDQSLGPEIRKQFQPWLKFVANSWAMERSGNEGLGKFVNKARANTTVVGMAWRVSTIVTQLAGYSNSFEYVGARWVTEAIARTTAHPVASFNFVMERSAEVRTRMDTLDRDIRLTISQMGGRRTPISDAKRFMFHGIGYADRMVVVPTWIGAYNKALAAGALEQDAIYEADKAVRKSQGAGSPKDLAAIQRGTGKWGELLRISTMFYSYMSAYYQRQRTFGRDVGQAVRERDVRATPRLLARAWWLIAVPPLLSELLAGRGPDEEDDWGYWAFKRLMLNVLGPIPFVRDLSQPIWDTLDGSPTFGYSITPLQRAGETIVKVAQDARKVAQGDEAKKGVQHTLEAAGYVTGLVPGQIATTTQFLVDVGQGEQDPDGFAEWWRGLTKGKAEAPRK